MNPATAHPTKYTNNHATVTDMNSPHSVEVELARLGATVTAAVDRLTETINRVEEAQAKTDAQIEELKKDVLHYKGIVGGAMFVLSGMWAALVAFKGWVFGVDR